VTSIVLDLGRNPKNIKAGKTISPFYQTELDVLKKYDYPTIDIKHLRPVRPE
jgi:hypothetical protein